MQEGFLPAPGLNAWPQWLQAYAAGISNNRQFSAFAPTLEGIQLAHQLRPKHPVNRSALHDVLSKQHQHCYSRFPLVRQNIEDLLREDVFTICTGHQLVPAFGPAFWYYKIATVVRLCRLLKSRGIHVIPLLWLASEDHDIDEISSLSVANEKIVREGEHSGACGRMSFERWKDFYHQVFAGTERLSEGNLLTEGIRLYESFNGTLSDWTRHLALHAFGEDGLLVLDADCAELKCLITDIAEGEVYSQKSFHALAEAQSDWKRFRGEDLPYPAFPRPYNFFLLNEGGRFRVERRDSGFVAGPMHFSGESDLIDFIKKQPEVFSPNVILRPVFQERVLPNLGYVGGPGEMAYWLQLKPVFDCFNTFFPALIPRDSYVVLPSFFQERWNKTGLGENDWIKPESEVLESFVALHSPNLSFFSERKKELEATYAVLSENLRKIDSTLVASAQAELTKSLQALDQIEKKVLRNIRKLQESKMNGIKSLLAAVQPNGQPQERSLSTLDLEQMMGERLSMLKQQTESPSMQTRLIRL